MAAGLSDIVAKLRGDAGGRTSRGLTRGERKAAIDAELAALRRQLKPFAESDAPVLAGPFLGEVGYEILYWIPFLRWALATFPALHGRLLIVSRGGV